MMPPGNSWTFNTLYGFTGSGGPQGNLIMDQAGSLYGTTTNDGRFGLWLRFQIDTVGRKLDGNRPVRFHRRQRRSKSV